MIPMVDLRGQYHALKDDIDAAVASVFTSAHFILGPNVQGFEEEAANYLGCKHAISCASGTDALHLALAGLNLGPGDEVITSPFTFIATAEAIVYTGATPVFVDVCPDSFNLDPALLEAAITPRTKAIIPVHLFGQPCNMAAIQQIAATHELKIIEDCAQSFGADINQKMTGSATDAGAFSFFPSKNLGCFGDGGLVTVNDDEVAQRIRQLRNHGSRKQYHHDIIGYNSRLDDVQAAILRVKLKHIDHFNTERRRVAHRYSEQLAPLGLTPPVETGHGTHVYHQYTLLCDQREQIMSALKEAEIASAIYYPIPLHQQKAFAEHCDGLSLPVCESVAQRCMSLPIFPELSDDKVDHIVSIIKESLG